MPILLLRTSAQRQVGGDSPPHTADAAAVYTREGFWGMRLRVDLAVMDVRNRSFDLVYLLTDMGTNEEIARAKHGAVFFDHAKKIPAAIPVVFRSAFAR